MIDENSIDFIIFTWINSGVSNVIFDRIMPLITFLGDHWAGWAFVIIYGLINHKQFGSWWRAGLFLSLIYGSVSAIQEILRYVIDRPRPFAVHEAMVRTSYPLDPSFPSGHATTAFMMATILAYQFPKYKYVFYILASLVGISRVYLGVHYPSDVIAGALVGYTITKLLISSRLLRGMIEKKI